MADWRVNLKDKQMIHDRVIFIGGVAYGLLRKGSMYVVIA